MEEWETLSAGRKKRSSLMNLSCPRYCLEGRRKNENNETFLKKITRQHSIKTEWELYLIRFCENNVQKSTHKKRKQNNTNIKALITQFNVIYSFFALFLPPPFARTNVAETEYRSILYEIKALSDTMFLTKQINRIK